MNVRLHVVPWLRRPMGFVLPNWLGITIGSRIISWRELNDAELEHELAHVIQWRAYGLLFPFAYLRASIAAMHADRHWYWGNEFEQAARLAVRLAGF